MVEPASLAVEGTVGMVASEAARGVACVALLSSWCARAQHTHSLARPYQARSPCRAYYLTLPY
eukprot:6204911-Pleurochrysis_carterae.AAC.2